MMRLDGATLRPLEAKDLEQLYSYRNDSEVTAGLGGFSTGYSRDALKAWLEAHRGRRDEVLWAIARTDDDVCLGHVGLYEIDHRVRKGEFAILLGPPGQGQGLGSTVTRAVVDYGFRELNLHKVTLTVLASNDRALKLYEGVGFRREGTLRDEQYRGGKYVDVIVMSLLEEEWRKQPKA